MNDMYYMNCYGWGNILWNDICVMIMIDFDLFILWFNDCIYVKY